MNKITDSEIRKLFFEFTDDEINGIRYLSQEAFKQALNQALNIHSVSNRREMLIDFAMWEIQEVDYQKHAEFLVDGYIKQKGN